MKKIFFSTVAIAYSLTATAQTKLNFVTLDIIDDIIIGLFKRYWYWPVIFIGGYLLLEYLIRKIEDKWR